MLGRLEAADRLALEAPDLTEAALLKLGRRLQRRQPVVPSRARCSEQLQGLRSKSARGKSAKGSYLLNLLPCDSRLAGKGSK